VWRIRLLGQRYRVFARWFHKLLMVWFFLALRHRKAGGDVVVCRK
jgi:hypothetical protein